MMDDRNKESLSALMDGEATEIEVRRLLLKEKGTELSETWLRYHHIRKVMRLNKNDVGPFDIHQQIADAIAEEPPLEWSKSTAGMFQQVEAHFMQTQARETKTEESVKSDNQQIDPARIQAAIQQGDKVVPFVDRRVNRSRRATDNVAYLPLPVQSSPKRWRRFVPLGITASVFAALLLSWNPFSLHMESQLTSSQLAHKLFKESAAQPLQIDRSHDRDQSSQQVATRVARMNEYMMRHAENVSYLPGQSILPLARVASYNAAPPSL
jgi:negative regulator of sigma E activity